MTSNLWSLCRIRPMCSSVSELPMPTSSVLCLLTGYVIFKDKNSANRTQKSNLFEFCRDAACFAGTEK